MSRIPPKLFPVDADDVAIQDTQPSQKANKRKGVGKRAVLSTASWKLIMFAQIGLSISVMKVIFPGPRIPAHPPYQS